VTATDTAVRLAQLAGHAAADKLATDIVLIDVSDRLAITDVFVIATGNNERQVEAIVDEIEEKLRQVGSKPLRREGKRDGRWVLLDYSDIVVHVQHAEERVFYALERLWRDCPMIDFDAMAAAPKFGEMPSGNGSRSAGETQSDEAQAGEAESREAEPGEAESDEAQAGEAEPGEAEPGEAWSDEAPADRTRSGDEAQPGQDRAEEA
jgi:ribosome-associated protein